MLNHSVADTAVFPDERACVIDEFRALVERATELEQFPFAAEIVGNFPVYDGAALREAKDDPVAVKRHKVEWHRAFSDGPGIIAIRGGYADLRLLEEVTAALSIW